MVDTTSLEENPIGLEDSNLLETVNGTFKNYTVNERTVFNFFPNADLKTSTNYYSTLQSGISDNFGNSTESVDQVDFTITSTNTSSKIIESFNDSFTSYWWVPQSSGSSQGLDANTSRNADNSIFNYLFAGSQSMAITYDWNINASSWLLREYLSGGSPRSVEFDTSWKIQIYIFGDGSNTKFRFALDEGTASSWPGHEVSKWYTINWIGWKLVEWDLSDPSETGSWIGNGSLDGTRYRFDSIQLTYNGTETGTLYFDDLRLEKDIITSIRNPIDAVTPAKFYLSQNYPNPFNPTTKINYGIPNPGWVKIEIYNSLGQKVSTIIDGYENTGHHSVTFNANHLAAGNYTVTIRYKNQVQVKKMTLLK
jgi:hypothetical protein